MPNLLAVQLESYNDFLQVGVADRRNGSQTGSSRSSTPSSRSNRPAVNLIMEYVQLPTGEPKYSDGGVPGARASPSPCRSRCVCAWSSRRRTRTSAEAELKMRHPEQEVYLGELPKHHRQGHVHHQRRRAGDRQPAAPLARACSSATRSTPTGRRLFTRAHHPLPRARGWSSPPTSTTCCTCTSTASASSRSPMLLRALGFDTNDEIIELFHEVEIIKVPAQGHQEGRGDLEGRILADIDAPTGRTTPCSRPATGHRRAAREHPENRRRLKELELIAVGEIVANEPSLILNTLRKDPTQHPDEALQEDLQPAASGRSAERGGRQGPVRAAVLQPREALRPGRGGPLQDQPAPGARRAAHHHDADAGRLRGHHPDVITCWTWAAARPTTSTTSATAASARWASCWPTSSRVGLSRMARIVKERMNLSDKEKPITPRTTW